MMLRTRVRNQRIWMVGALGLVLALGASWLDLAFSQVSGDSRPLSNQDRPRTSSMALPSHTNNAWEMPPIVLKGLDGKVHRLSEWKGKVIMLNFWASWCGPCQYEIPDLVRYQSEYAKQGLQVVGLGLDDARKLGNVKRTLGINYPVLVADLADQANARLLPQWGNSEQIVPYTVVIAPSGRMVYIHRGQLGDDEFANYVRPLLENPSS